MLKINIAEMRWHVELTEMLGTYSRSLLNAKHTEHLATITAYIEWLKWQQIKENVRDVLLGGICLCDATDCACVWFVLDIAGTEVLPPSHIQAWCVFWVYSHTHSFAHIAHNSAVELVMQEYPQSAY